MGAVIRVLPLLASLLLLPFVSAQEEPEPLSVTQPSPAPAQEEPAPTISPAGPPASTSAQDELSRKAIDSLAVSLEETRAMLAKAEQENNTERIEIMKARLAGLNADLETVATGQNFTSEVAVQPEVFDLQGELTDLLEPLVEQLKAATKSPRDVEELKTQINTLETQLEDSTNALERLRALSAKPDLPEGLAASLKTLNTKWESRHQAAETALSVATFKLGELEASRGSLLDSLSDIFSSFFQERGLNLLIAAAVAIAIWLTLSWLRSRVEKLPSFRKKKGRTFSSRAAGVLFIVGTTIAVVVGVLMVFYLANDWVLLGLSLLLILGVVWAGKTALPRVFDQLKLMLNLGSVREGERVVIDGVPWEVKRLNVFSEFTNPALEGGTLRLPIRDVLPLASRPFSQKEPWFPCDPGDWVRLGDGLAGKVITQTPEWVQLILLGGSRKTFATPDFIAENPESLAHNFRVRSTFGIDYEHQAICTTEVPKIFTDHLLAHLREEVGEKNVVSVVVEFASAGASSLDYAILADFSGEVSAKNAKLERTIQRLCVDVCNEHGWGIPFTQITLHNAE
ncbi:hypothetical protein OAF27_00205 [Verrucomicrobiales bacterium]|nr:hypothetical protein [Verrucomicrobiales bacterium]